jgi:DNA-binding transcriptional LysR family regulator
VDVPACVVSDDLGMLHEAARAGVGLGVLPRERLPTFPAYAVLASARHVPRRVRVLVDSLAERLRGPS